MRIFLAAILSVLSVCASATSFTRCGHFTIGGRVLDRAGQPIADAAIDVAEDSSSPDRTKPWTDLDGIYHFEVVYPNPCTKELDRTSVTVTIRAKGYIDKRETFPLGQKALGLRHILEKSNE